ncbi:hypothetical protein GCM10020001_041880 [Nonomuraea salmonea]
MIDLLGAKRVRSFTHVPYQRVGPSRIPDLYVPFELRLSPHLDGARRELVSWCREMGILEPPHGVAGPAVWDEAKLVDYDLPLCAAGLHPGATPEELDLASAWLAWGGRTATTTSPSSSAARATWPPPRWRSPGSATSCPSTARPPPAPANALERSLADIWARTAGPMPQEDRRKLRAAVEEMCEAWLWELAGEIAHHIPDPVDYIEMRRHTFGSELTMSLSRLRHSTSIPEEFYASGPMVALENAMMDAGMLINDVFSYQKEIEYEGEVHNAILVVQNFFGCDHPTALGIVADLMASRVRQFEHIAANELPIVCDDFGLGEEARRDLDGFLTELGDWLAGILNWHQGCFRYDEPSLQRHHQAPLPRFHGPTGLGTSAAVIRPPGAVSPVAVSPVAAGR